MRQGASSGTDDKGPQTADGVPILVRREIEARALRPFIEAFAEEFGRERTLDAARRVIASLAEDGGRAMASAAGGSSPECLERALDMFGLGAELTREGDRVINYTVHSCPYKEMYERLGMEELGYLLSCERDPSTFAGFNKDIKFSREKSLMRGDDCCDMRFEYPPD